MAEGGVGRTVNLWVQSLAIVATGLWALWTFVYLEYSKPASAPINLSTQLDVREAGVGTNAVDAQGRRLVAIELQVTASNPSTRTVYVLHNYWIAYGVNIAGRPNEVDWVAAANQGVQQRMQGTAVGEHFAWSNMVMVASGSVMPDDSLKPGESVSRSYVFYVPEGAYDMVDVATVVPSASSEDVVDLEWTIARNGQVTPAVYRLQGDQRVPMEMNAEGDYSADEINLQQATSQRQLSLWRRPN